MTEFNDANDYPFDDAKQMLAIIQKEINANLDKRNKEIGDKVLVWDGSYNIDKNTSIKRSGIDPLFKTEAIVIETNCKIIFKVDQLFFEKRDDEVLDVLLKFPTGEEVYTNSRLIKRTDNCPY